MIANEENKSNSSPKCRYRPCLILRKEPNVSVYLAQDNQNKLSIIKSIEMSNMAEKERKISAQEVKLINKLDHPYIIKQKEHFFTKSETKKTLHIVMEYVSGGDLAQIIKSKKTKYISETLILDWFTQLCLAVKHVHDRKILHRNIKPSNIFLKSNNHIKLGDFGIAKCLNNAKEKAITYIGSPEYLSPEIMLNRPYSFQSDIWAMGVTLFELCALKQPFTSDELKAIENTKIVPSVCIKIPKHYSNEIKKVIEMMLKSDPIHRPFVGQLLSIDIIQRRITKFFTKEEYNKEFSHSLLKDFIIDKDERRECDKCIKAKKEKSKLKISNDASPNPIIGSGYVENFNNIFTKGLTNNNYLLNKDVNVISNNNNKHGNGNNSNRKETFYYQVNDIIQRPSNDNSNDSNAPSLSPGKKLKFIIKEKNTMLFGPEDNIERRRNEIENEIGVELLKAIYNFLIGNPNQLIQSILVTDKSIEEIVSDCLKEKGFASTVINKGLKRLKDINELIIKGKKHNESHSQLLLP